MRASIVIPVIALTVFLLIAGCTIAPGPGPAGTATTTAATMPPGTATPVPTTPELPTVAQTVAVTTTGPTIPVPDPFGESPTLKTVAVVTGISGHQTVNISVPYGYWEMWYTADPLATGGQDSHAATGSQSAVFPSLAILVSDPATGKEIATVEPPGSLDISLWQRAGDPRPWSKKFFVGDRMFVFDVTARHLKSYLIGVRIPK